MKTSYGIVHSMGAVALVLAGAAQAEVTRTNFLDQWTVSGGNITAACPTGFDCAAALSDNGFLTRLVTDSADGKQYFQTIVTMPDATAIGGDLDTLEFSDENAVSYSNTNGILDKQRISQIQTLAIPLQSDTHDIVFKNGSVIGTGWANDFVELTQSITDVNDPSGAVTGNISNGDGFQIDFIYKQVGYSDGSTQLPTGKGMKLTNYVPLGALGTGVDERQDFVLVETQGSFTAAGGVSLTPIPNSVPPRGGDMTWAADDRVQAVWIGEALPSAGQTFGYGGYTKFVDATSNAVAATSNTFSLANTLGDPITGVPNNDAVIGIDWDVATWGDLKTSGTITAPFPDVP